MGQSRHLSTFNCQRDTAPVKIAYLLMLDALTLNEADGVEWRVYIDRLLEAERVQSMAQVARIWADFHRWRAQVESGHRGQDAGRAMAAGEGELGRSGELPAGTLFDERR